MGERAGEAIEGIGRALKRRGILAAAGAAVAGIVAKQAAQPVAAGGTDHQAMIIGEINTEGLSGTGLNWTGGTIASGAVLEVTDGGGATLFQAAIGGIATAGKAAIGVYGESITGAGTVGLSQNSHGVNGASTSGNGVRGKSESGYGVRGESLSNVGVRGTSLDFHGVLGGTTATGNGTAGVYGAGYGDGTFGTIGYNFGAGVGMVGNNDNAAGTGVKGTSASGYPMIGVATDGANANAGVLGVGTAGPGVQGQSYAGHGLVGTTSATDGQHAGLIGTVQPGGNGVGLRGSIPAGATGFAGVFDGDLIVNGALRVYGSPKNAAVKHPTDNSYRLLYCEESPESWFADYGEGTLANGKAEVKLDPDFAALVHADKYHVFLTEYGGHSGLYVADKGPAGFSVAADVAASGTKAPTKAGGGTFSWRVVAKRKDIAGERLAKVAPPPPLKAVMPFTVPETPAPKPPATKP